jgi:acetyl-CoA acetyltransferase
LAATVLKALKERNMLDTSTVDDIIWSTSTQEGKQGGDLGRMSALAAPRWIAFAAVGSHPSIWRPLR